MDRPDIDEYQYVVYDISEIPYKPMWKFISKTPMMLSLVPEIKYVREK